MTYTQAKEAIKALDRSGLEELIDDIGIDILEAGLAVGLPAEEISAAYAGEYGSPADFARSMAEEIGALKNDAEWPHTCIDWDFAAKELMYDYSEEGGYYFRNV